MTKKPSKRILGMTQTEFLILVILGGLMVCILVMGGGYIIYDLNRSSSVAILPPAPTPTITPQPIQLLPTFTPKPAQPPSHTNTPQPINTPILPTPTHIPIGMVNVDNWKFEITETLSEPSVSSDRQLVVLIGKVTNNGRSTDTFSDGAIVLRDSQGRKFEYDFGKTLGAPDRYDVGYGASISPGATESIAIIFDVPATEKSFTIVPGLLVASWSGNITFQLP